MSLSESLLPEFDREMANLRRTLERIPDEKLDFKPHPRSSTMGWLASHLAIIPTWATFTIQQDGFNASADTREPVHEKMSDVMANFDKNLAAARTALSAASDEELNKMWTLSSEGKEVFSMPKIECLRSFIMNHMIHHRAQLTVYLRMNDLPVPALYGPSADEAA